MEVQIDPHTLERAKERGASEDEVKDVVLSGEQFIARHGRLGKTKLYDFKQQRNGKYYEQKKVEVIYTVSDNITTTVTVYVFYGTWEI